MDKKYEYRVVSTSDTLPTEITGQLKRIIWPGERIVTAWVQPSGYTMFLIEREVSGGKKGT